MSDSFKRIDYSLRPAKYAERRMLCDIFRRLSAFGPIENYRYVGFGSVWFSDFILFHRALGIKDMLSIEKAVSSRERIEFNKPYSINIDFRHSNNVLPDLDYSKHQFIWLDYDDTISSTMLTDVSTVASRAQSGTVLIISVQCSRAPDINEADRQKADDPSALSAVERFRQRFGADRVAPNVDRAALTGWSFGELSRSMFYEEVQRALATRQLVSHEPAIICTRICDFEYEDGVKMVTLALVFSSLEDEPKLKACRFETLEFLMPDGKAVYIPTPKLTLREFRLLESQLPLNDERELQIGNIPASEAKGFANMYRYFPNFGVIES